MAASRKNRQPSGNRLLASLPPASLKRLMSHLEPVSFEVRQVLYEQDKPIDNVYFPQSGVFSLVVKMRDGTMVEAATVGNEGMVGIGVLLESVHVHLRAFSQVRGQCLRMSAAAFKKAIDRDRLLHRLMHRYAEALIIQFTQRVACNRLHTVEERAARWLLQTHDRVESDNFPLTQDFLAQMLGVRRASVTVVAGILQKAGLIRYNRGILTVLNRKGLEKSACECYSVINNEFERLVDGRG